MRLRSFRLPVTIRSNSTCRLPESKLIVGAFACGFADLVIVRVMVLTILISSMRAIFCRPTWGVPEGNVLFLRIANPWSFLCIDALLVFTLALNSVLVNLFYRQAHWDRFSVPITGRIFWRHSKCTRCFASIMRCSISAFPHVNGVRFWQFIDFFFALWWNSLEIINPHLYDYTHENRLIN